MTSALDFPLEIWALIVQELSLLALSKLFNSLVDVPVYSDIFVVTEMQAVKVL
jgi:hypothetical protein